MSNIKLSLCCYCRHYVWGGPAPRPNCSAFMPPEGIPESYLLGDKLHYHGTFYGKVQFAEDPANPLPDELREAIEEVDAQSRARVERWTAPTAGATP